MIKRWTMGIVAALLVAVGGFAGAAYASTTSDIGSFGLDLKEVQETFSSPATGRALMKVQCPSGYSPPGGGGFAQSSGGSNLPLLVSAPYDDGNRGWQVMYDIPAGTWTVFVYVSCAKVS